MSRSVCVCVCVCVYNQLYLHIPAITRNPGPSLTYLVSYVCTYSLVEA